MKSIRTHSEYSWSLLDPRPVLKYVDFLDEYIVYWNGVVMPHTVALNIAMESFNVFPTPKMKATMHSTYKRIYYSNGFGSMPHEWNDAISTGRVYNYIKSLMFAHLDKTIDKYSPQEVLGWFDYSNARRESSKPSYAE